MKRKTKKILFYSVLWLVMLYLLVVAYTAMHGVATAHRGYNAIGGEVAVFFLPALVYFTYINARDTKEEMKK